MKPVTLSVQAFGPYAAATSIDFTRLGDAPLFLIHGPTGAGKTSILDGICYALYGESSGGRRDGRTMRSDFAAPDLPTEVTFDFLLGARRYRIRRRPQQLSVKQRGAGTTERPAEAWLWEGDALLANKPNEVRERIIELLGFRDDQFRQVVLLPQGEFQRFLLAAPRDREALLAVLFQTHLYKRVEESLQEQSKELLAQWRTLDTRTQTLLGQAGAADADELARQLAAEQDALAALEAEAAGALTAVTAAEAALGEARRVADLYARRDAAAAAYAELAAKSAKVAETEQRLEAAQRADRVWPAITQHQERSAELTAARTAEQDHAARARLAAQEAQAAAAAALRSAAEEPARDRDVAEYAALTALRPALAQWEEISRSAAAAEAEARRLAPLAAAARETAEARAAERATQEARLPALEAAAASRAADQVALTHARQAAQERRQRDLAAAEAAQIAPALETALARWRALDEALLRGQAAHLAATLTDGAPCPVCGSLDHPAPAAGGAEPADRAHVNAARQEWQRLSERAAVLGQQAAGSGAPLPAAAECWAAEEAAERRAAASESAETERRQLLARLQAVEAARRQAEAEAAQAAQLAQGAADEALRTATRRAEAARQLPEELRSMGTLERAITSVAARIARRDAERAQVRQREQETAAAASAASALAAAAVESARLALSRQQSAETAMAAAVAECGFASAEAAAAARLDAARQSDWAARVREFHANLAAAAAQSAAAAREAEGLAPADLAGANAALLAARQRLDQLRQEQGARRNALATRRGIAAQLASLAVEAAEVETRQRRVGEMAEVASGRNGKKLRLQAFAQLAFLEDVLAAATLRLRRMSSGRYELHHPPGAQGLEMRVLDYHTGALRGVETLSGGEMFLASLALALGLSDIVQSTTGGVRLDSLFVDEGFGSLDPETLDLAMNTLSELRLGGRLVGIISHVSELRERIPLRLEVTPGPRGSQVRLISPDTTW